MKKILILGGYGQTGRSLARHILQSTGSEIVIAGRRPDKALSFARQLDSEFAGGRASAVKVDAASVSELEAALDGVDLLLVAAPTTGYAENVIRTALKMKADYLDVQLGAQKLALLRALAPDIERAGVCFITEAGFHPGLPAALVRRAASMLDRPESALVGCYLNMGRGPVYTTAVDELMEALRDYQGQVFKDGQWTRAGSYDMRKIDFGQDIGTRQCFSMFFEELRGIPEMYPSLTKLGCYMSGSHWVADWVISPVVMLGLKIWPRRAVRPMGRLMWWGMQNFSRPPQIVMLKAEVAGERNGQPAVVEASVSHRDGYELTAIPVVACLKQYLDGSARRPGLWMMGHLAEPQRLFEDMEKMGIRVELKTRQPGGGAG